MAIEELDPKACRMWQLHERLGDDVNEKSCAPLLESMRCHGQRTAVLGRTVTDENGSRVELIYGSRRLFAARYLGTKLLVDVREIDDRSALIEMDVENRVRVDICAYERGLSYRRWLARGYFSSQAALARSLGVSEAQVSRILKYADLPSAVVGAFKSARNIREEWAITLSKLCRDPGRRSTITRRARDRGPAAGLETPEDIYAALIYDKTGGESARRAHDEVITDGVGNPLLRIGLRLKTVHLILPRESVSVDLLSQITEEVSRLLRDASPASIKGKQGHAGTGERDTALPAGPSSLDRLRSRIEQEGGRRVQLEPTAGPR